MSDITLHDRARTVEAEMNDAAKYFAQGNMGDALYGLVLARDELELAICDVITVARKWSQVHGWAESELTWDQIGARLGVTKQAAQQRYGYLAR